MRPENISKRTMVTMNLISKIEIDMQKLLHITEQLLEDKASKLQKEKIIPSEVKRIRREYGIIETRWPKR
jgi:hypothetical protein